MEVKKMGKQEQRSDGADIRMQDHRLKPTNERKHFNYKF